MHAGRTQSLLRHTPQALLVVLFCCLDIRENFALVKLFVFPFHKDLMGARHCKVIVHLTGFIFKIRTIK